MFDHLADDAFRQGGVEIHTYLREFYTDIGIQGARVNGVEELMIDAGGFLRLSFGSNALSERVESGCNALAIHPFARSEDISSGHAGDEAAGQLAAQAGAFREGTHGFVLRESNKSRSKQTVIPLTPPGWRTGGIVSC